MITKIKIRILQNEEWGCHLIIKVRFNHKKTGYLILDTGASKTVFDETLLKPYIKDIEDVSGIQSTGIEARLLENKAGVIPYFQAGELEIKNYRVILMNLDNINQLYEKMTRIKIWGLIGGDFLYRYKAQIDYRNEVLILKYK